MSRSHRPRCFVSAHRLDDAEALYKDKDMMRLKLKTFAVLLLLIAIAPAAFANDYGAVRGVVHDPQHRPIQNAMVMLRAKSSDWAKSVTTDANGEFQFNAVALGEYSVSVASQGLRANGAGRHGHLGICAGRSLSIASGRGQ